MGTASGTVITCKVAIEAIVDAYRYCTSPIIRVLGRDRKSKPGQKISEYNYFFHNMINLRWLT